jgi:hypothetical protein
VRKECSPLLGTRARAVNTSSSLAYQISDVESIATVSTDGDRSDGVRLSVKRTDEAEERPGELQKGEEKQEVMGLGLSFKNPFSSTPKRDSLSPISTSIPTSLSTSIPPTTISFPHSILSHLPHHLTPTHTTTTLLPPSPKQTHPYTSNTHITPSCTYGALTHRLECGHSVLTLKVEVCGRNCVYGSTSEEGEGDVRMVRMEGVERESRGLWLI